METFLIYLLFVIGIVIIVKGGDAFVDAATWIAEVSGIPHFVIGATIVSLATTLPELIVSSLATHAGKIDMAIGNAVGSVTANTGMIMAISILFMPSLVKRKSFAFKGIMLMAIIALLLILSLDGSLSVAEGFLLLLALLVFIYDNLMTGKNNEEKPEKLAITRKDTIVNSIKFVLGAIGIVIGSQLLVDKGSSIALSLGVSEKIIGFTAIAIGTSLPELVTTITAIAKKQSSLSVGNIIGANIIDTALILPICAFISHGTLPVAAQSIRFDIPVCLGIAIVAILPAIIREKFTRVQGGIMLTLYVGYLIAICI